MKTLLLSFLSSFFLIAVYAQNPMTALQRANQLFEQKAYEKAVVAFEEALKLPLHDSVRAEAQSLLGMSLAYAGKWQESIAPSFRAIELYESSLGITNASTIDAIYNLSHIYSATMNFDSLLF